ncbi:hypothetical protein GOODEAATRI_022800, partial [Goodea atripinnis]
SLGFFKIHIQTGMYQLLTAAHPVSFRKKMEKDTVIFSPGGSPSQGDRLRQAPQRGFYLGPAPLYIKPPRFSSPSYHGMSPTIDPYSAFTTPGFFPLPSLGYVPKDGSQKRKRFLLKTGPQGGESLEREQGEAEESTSKKKLDSSHVPFPPRSISSMSSRLIPGMIELNRLQLHNRSAGMSLPVQVKQEPPSPSSLWPTSPLLLHPPYFPPLAHSPFPYPVFMPGPVMHIPPGAFYPREDPRASKAPHDEAPRSETTNTEKAGLNVHVDDSYYVDVGGDQKRWKCRMCEKSYTSKYNLVTHILGHNGIKPHGCHLCGKLFKQLSHLHTHLLTHQGMRPHKCQVCHKAFTQTSHLKRHMMQHSDVKPYSVCGRGFAYPSELRAHELKHEKGQENVCVECGLDFPTLSQLKRHLTVHRGPTLYRCTECQKTFQYPSQLQNHMMKHKDIRPYICSECGMEFIQSHHLKQHTLTHKGVKEHKCRICGREFTLLANMKRHVLIHTNIRAYQCHMCFKKSSYESDAEVDEQAYNTERVHTESFDYDSISEDECKQSKQPLDGSYEAIDVNAVISCQMKCRTAASPFLPSHDHRVPEGETANSLRKFSHPPPLSFPHLHVSIPAPSFEKKTHKRWMSAINSQHLSKESHCLVRNRFQLGGLMKVLPDSKARIYYVVRGKARELKWNRT